MKLTYKCEKCKKTYDTEDECKKCETLCQEFTNSFVSFVKTFSKWRDFQNKTPKEYKDLDDFIRKNPNISDDGLHCELNPKCLNVDDLPRFYYDRCCCDKREPK